MEMKFAEINGEMKEVVIMTMEEYEFERNLMKSNERKRTKQYGKRR